MKINIARVLQKYFRIPKAMPVKHGHLEELDYNEMHKTVAENIIYTPRK